ncbi:hypothetical protein M885DRAFT_170500 [Pelagophyceae sp. CCMP2097]|nr:hypothetical protein M885DRAFT_170500 [Pelagophyceae sp. CCMP2097]
MRPAATQPAFTPKPTTTLMPVPSPKPTPKPTLKPAPIAVVRQLKTEFVLDGSTITGSAANFSDAAKEELVDVIVDATDAITNASQITDLEVFDVVARRRSILAAGDSDVGVSYVVTVGAGSDSAATADALKLSLKTSITSGALDARLAKSVDPMLARAPATTNGPASLAAIDASTYVVVVGPAPTPAPTPRPTDATAVPETSAPLTPASAAPRTEKTVDGASTVVIIIVVVVGGVLLIGAAAALLSGACRAASSKVAAEKMTERSADPERPWPRPQRAAHGPTPFLAVAPPAKSRPRAHAVPRPPRSKTLVSSPAVGRDHRPPPTSAQGTAPNERGERALRSAPDRDIETTLPGSLALLSVLRAE